MRYALSLLCGLVGLLEAHAASAQTSVDGDGSLPASVCQKKGSGGTLAIGSDGSIYNSQAAGGSSLVVDCPVASTGQGEMTFSGTELWYIDNSTQALTCELRSEFPGAAVQVLARSSNHDDAAAHVFDLAALDEIGGGYLHVVCTIPPRDAQSNASYLVGVSIEDNPSNSPIGFLGYHTRPASACRKVGTGGVFAIQNDGSVINDAPSTGEYLFLECPIMTTRQGAPTGDLTRVWYVDDSPNPIYCTLAAENPSNGARSLFTAGTADNDPFPRVGTFSGAFGITTFDGGYAHLTCALPPKDTDGGASRIKYYAFEPLTP